MTHADLVWLNRPMTKVEVIEHLERHHSQAVVKPISPRRWTKTELVDLHRLIHLGLGR